MGGALEVVVAGLVLVAACGETATPPPTMEICELTGSPYERGFQHGQRFGSKISSLYTMLLENSLLPYLNREQKDVAAFLFEYQKPLYGDGQFSYQLLLQSGQALAAELEETYPEYLEEMRGIADGSGLPYEKILILNTFVDTMLAFRSITFFIRQLQAPYLVSAEFVANLETDGIDNNGDGEIDDGRDAMVRDFRKSAGWTDNYGPREHASMVEVPGNSAMRFVLRDPPALTSFEPDETDPDKLKEGEEQGVDPMSIRIQLGNDVYEAGTDSCISVSAVEGDSNSLEVLFTPPGGLADAAIHSLLIQAGNLSRIVDPPPVHARFMRDERIVFTTAGYGKEAHEIPNRGEPDGRTQPPSIAFGVRDSASADGRIRLAHHFALLDANVSHKHTVLFIHRPEEGKAHAVLGWTGVIWGFAGMNEDGLSMMITSSDSLNNSLAGRVQTDLMNAKLLASGTPVGLILRKVLAGQRSVDDARNYLKWTGATFGWNFLLGDRFGGMAAVEMDANIMGVAAHGFAAFGLDDETGNTDAHGRALGSVGPDDLRIACHYQKNVPDIDDYILIFEVRPQRYWSSFYYRSLRTHHTLGEEISARYGEIGLSEMFQILRTPALVDSRDSMTAVVFEPSKQVLHYALGKVPATDGPFVRFDLGQWLEGRE